MNRPLLILTGLAIATLAVGPAALAVDGTNGSSGPAMLDFDTDQLYDSQDPPNYVTHGPETKTQTGHGTTYENQICVSTGQQIINITSNTSTATGTGTGSATASSTSTASSTITASTSNSGTATCTGASASLTGTAQVTLTATTQDTVTLTASISATDTYTTTETTSGTGTVTLSGTATVSATDTWTVTESSTQSKTGVGGTSCPGGTGTQTATVTITYGFTASATATGTATNTVTGTSTESALWTYTKTGTATCALGPTSTISTTQTAVATGTYLNTDVTTTGSDDSATTWTTVTEMSVTVAESNTYSIDADLYLVTSEATGSIFVAVGGTATITNGLLQFQTWDSGTSGTTAGNPYTTTRTTFGEAGFLVLPATIADHLLRVAGAFTVDVAGGGTVLFEIRGYVDEGVDSRTTLKKYSKMRVARIE